MKYILFFFFIPLLATGQSQLTAEDILDRSIAFCGGEDRIAKIKTAEMIYNVTTGDSGVTSLAVKIISSQMYMRSTLSDVSVSTFLQYNGSGILATNGNEITSHTDPSGRVKLLTYILPQYGYKALSYSLNREPDKKFKAYDCYVLKATSPEGYTSLNYFDKTDYRLIMIIYPDGDKSLMTGYIYRDSVLVHTQIVNVNDGRETRWNLKKVEHNRTISPLWFGGRQDSSQTVPEQISRGVFRSRDGTIVTRTASSQTEHAANGHADDELVLRWVSNDTFLMTDTIASGKASAKGVLVKIVSWDDSGYVCHYFSHGISGTQDYTIVK